VADATRQNLNLRQAAERIVQARAFRDISRGNMYPQVQNAAGAASLNKQSSNNAIGSNNQWFQDVQVGFNVGWELDFWGRFRRSIEAADANLEASVASYDNVMVLLLAEVAASYVQYRTFQERLYYAQQNVEIQRQAFELAKINFETGASSERDVHQSRQVYEQTRALIPQFEQGLRQSGNALCALLGLPSQDLAGRLGDAGRIPSTSDDIIVGIPADLLRRRPDVRQAERRAAEQSALIGVAKSDLYPHFSLTGSIGLNSEYTGGLWRTPDSFAGSIGPGFRWDVLNYGRIENAIRGQESRFREAIFSYQQTVLQANREAEDALVAFTKTREQEAFLRESVDAARRTVQITYDQYRLGAVDFTPLFLFELTLTEQEDALAQIRGAMALSVVELYRAIGGGWESRLEPDGIVGPAVEGPTTQRVKTLPDLIRPFAPPGASPANGPTTRPEASP
jgi:NodT family efflux transporter outer membrane factor (OMF) lipoprotein